MGPVERMVRPRRHKVRGRLLNKGSFMNDTTMSTIEDSADKSPLASDAKNWVLKPNGLWEPTGGTDTKMPFDEVGFSIVNCDFEVEGGAWKRVWVDKRVIDKDGGIPVGTVGWE